MRMIVIGLASGWRAVLGFIAAGALSFAVASVALGVGNGAQNGEDTSCCGWIGSDNPDSVSGSYAYGNVTQNLILSEWVEPSHDWVRSRNMYWAQGVEDYLDAQTGSHAMDYEFRIHDQTYYNFVNGWNTNLPWSKAPENENAIEEFQQGYTEVDMEQNDPWRITANFGYFYDQQFDSEKPAVNGAPRFYSELEWCNKTYTSCNYDETGLMNKKVLQQ